VTLNGASLSLAWSESSISAEKHTGPDLFETRGAKVKLDFEVPPTASSIAHGQTGPATPWAILSATQSHKKIELEAPVGFCFTVSTVKHMGFEPPPWAITLILKFLLH
jgi:hypothetical protein